MEHHFNVEFAQLYGIEEAIIVHNLYFWIVKNIANNAHIYNGRYWTYNSNNALAALFPYINKTKICRVMAHLESENIILKDNFNKDSRDRTLWYSFSDEGIKVLNNCGYNIFKMTKCTVQNELCKIQNEPPLPYNKQTDSKQKEEKDKSFSKKDDINYSEILTQWKRINPNLKQPRMIDEKRKQSIRTLLKNNNATIDDLYRTFQMISISSYCNANHEKNRTWKASFDWLIKNTQNCFNRLLEGQFVSNKEEEAKAEKILNGNWDENDVVQTAASSYHPYGNFSIMYDEINHRYIYTAYDFSMIADGYTDDERPDGAVLILNSGRGTLTWSKAERRWIHKK